MAGAVGIEPTLTVLETVVLPLNYAPIKSSSHDGIEPPTPPACKAGALSAELILQKNLYKRYKQRCFHYL